MPQSAPVSSERGWIWEGRGDICGNDLIVSMRILSNQDASVCFPEPRADINNVAYLALCRLAEECWWRKSQTGIWSSRLPAQPLKSFYWVAVLKLQPGPWRAVYASRSGWRSHFGGRRLTWFIGERESRAARAAPANDWLISFCLLNPRRTRTALSRPWAPGKCAAVANKIWLAPLTLLKASC